MSTKLETMRSRLAEIETEMRSIHTEAGDAALSEDQTTRWSALDTEESDLRAQVEAEEAAEKRAAEIAEKRARWNSVQVAPTKKSAFDGIDNLRSMSEDEVVSRAVSALEDVHYRGVNIKDDWREAATRAVESIPGAAAHALVHSSPDYVSAFRSWFTAGARGQAPVLTQAEADAVRASMSLTSANGGYTLPTLLDPTLIHTGTASKNPIRNIARVVSGTANVWNGVTSGNVTTAWKSEGSAFTDGSPTFGGVSVTAAALTAYVTGSYEIFEDSNLLGQLPGLIGEAIDYAEGTAFVSGSGSGAPKGVITAVSGTAGSLVTATTRGTFSSASGVDTLALYNSLPTRYEDSATWVANKQTFVSIQQQTIGTSGILVADMTLKRELLGLPIVRASSVTSTTTSGNILAVLGDFSQYVVYDRIGVNLEFIQNVVDGSGIPTGQRGLVAHKRVGGDVSDVNAFRLLKA